MLTYDNKNTNVPDNHIKLSGLKQGNSMHYEYQSDGINSWDYPEYPH